MIRRANGNDIDKVAEIYNEIHTEEEQGRMTIGWKREIYPTVETAREAFAQGELYVEEEEGRIVAAARINQAQVPEYVGAAWEYDAPEEEVLVLHTLVVSPSASGRGYGSRFVAFYEAMALERGCPFLRMDTNERNQNARNLYRKLGYREAGIVPCVFNGLEGVQLVCLEKKLDC